jgi:hypothetical protein
MTAHLGDLEKRIEAMSRLRSQLAQLVATDVPIDGPLTNDLLQVLEEMIMLDTTVQRRISILVYSDIEASYGYLERVFGLGPGQLTATRVDTSFTARSKQATVWCGFTQNLLNSRWPPQVARSHYGEYGRDGR